MPALAPSPQGMPALTPSPKGMPALTPAPAGVPWKVDLAPPAWPASIPEPAEAASALRAALAGSGRQGSPLAGLDEVLASLADVELAVLAGEPLPIEPEPIRQAAVTRVRVAAALATVPAAGEPVDAAAVSALLAEIDGLLSRVNELASGAPEDLQPSLEAVRNALVREAIDFSEAAQRASPAGAPAVVPAPAPAGRPSKTRIVSVDAEPERASRRRVAAWIAIAAVIGAGAGYHGWRWHKRGTARATLAAGLPAGLTQIPGPPGGPRVLVRSSTTEPPDPAEIARFKATEEAKGNAVRDSDGMIFIEPAREAAPAPSPPSPRSTP
jgi:hypothetical protein